MRWPCGILLAVLSITSAVAQGRPAGFAEAEKAFDELPIRERVRQQMLLTATGYWIAVASGTFGPRLFTAVQDFQSAHGFDPTGILTEPQGQKLEEEAAPLLETWGFRAVAHPARRQAIWVPFGLGLTSERDAEGISWKADGKVSLSYQLYSRLSLKETYELLLANAARDLQTVHYKVIKPEFLAISMSSSKGVDSYIRFHRNAVGVLGFFLHWNQDARDLHMERASILISGSLWAAMTKAPYIEPGELFGTAGAQTAVRADQKLDEEGSDRSRPPDGSKASSGTGFFITKEGHVLTNDHVIEDCRTIETSGVDMEKSVARVVARDRANDLALLKTELTPKRVAAFRVGVRLGEGVAAFGYPLSSLLATSGNFTLGNITALAGMRDDSRYLQVSAPVQPGNSGGPLLDQSGNVIGVVSAKLDALKVMVATNGDIPQNVNFAIRGSIASGFLESNRIAVEQAAASDALTAPDLADSAREMSVFVSCTR